MREDSLGVTLKKHRRYRNITQKQAADEMGMSVRQYRKYETGAVPSIRTYERLARFLGCAVESISAKEISGSYLETKEYKSRKRANRRKKKAKDRLNARKRRHQYAKKYRKWMPKDQWLEMMRPKWEKMRKKKLERVNRKRENGVPLTDREIKFLQSMGNA